MKTTEPDAFSREYVAELWNYYIKKWSTEAANSLIQQVPNGNPISGTTGFLLS